MANKYKDIKDKHGKVIGKKLDNPAPFPKVLPGPVFMLRFPEAKRADLYKTNNGDIAFAVALLDHHERINLRHDWVGQALDILVAENAITAAEKDAILA